MNSHDTLHWHPPLGHHHGSDPRTSELWPLYLEAAGQEIGYKGGWYSSDIENIFPFPAGKHEGFTFLREDDTGRTQSERTKGANFIDAYLLMIHTIGDGHAARARFHSHYGVFAVSDDKGNGGLVATGGHGDYGILMSPYKDRVVPLPGDPLNWPYGERGEFGLPYRATLKSSPGLNTQYWNSQGQGRVKTHPHRPNNILQLAWSQLDCWSRLDVDYPDDPHMDTYFCPDGSCEFNGSLFQVNAIKLLRLPTERPFSGFTNVHGHVIEATEAGPNAVPLIITEGVPQGDAILARTFLKGNCSEAPCQEFDDGTPLFAPGLGGHG